MTAKRSSSGMALLVFLASACSSSSKGSSSGTGGSASSATSAGGRTTALDAALGSGGAWATGGQPGLVDAPASGGTMSNGGTTGSDGGTSTGMDAGSGLSLPTVHDWCKALWDMSCERDYNCGVSTTLPIDVCKSMSDIVCTTMTCDMTYSPSHANACIAGWYGLSCAEYADNTLPAPVGCTHVCEGVTTSVGGATGTGGMAASGGATGTGGAPRSGGTTGKGGAGGTGGATRGTGGNSGGTSGTGGSSMPNVDCGKLTSPTSGSVSVSSTTYGSKASYECGTLYNIEGDALRTCQADGTWSGAAPTCVLMLNNTLSEVEEFPVSIAVGGPNVYWTNEDGTLRMVPRVAGGTPTLLTAGPAVAEVLAADATYVYWLNGATKGVMKTPIAGGDSATLGTYDGSQIPTQMLVDANNLYWSYSTSSSQGGVVKAPLDGRAAVILTPDTEPVYAITIDASNVYYATAKTVAKTSLNGGAPTTLASGQDASSLAVDSTSIYWANGRANWGSGSVLKMALGGGTPTTLASQQHNPIWIAVDSTNVYFIEADSGGAVKKMGLDGGPLAQLTDRGYQHPGRFVVDSTSIYWINNYWYWFPVAGTYGRGMIMKISPK